MNKPIVGITMGDPAGSGPEITIKALADPEQYTYCRPIVVGDVKVFEQARKFVGREDIVIHRCDKVSDALFTPGTIDVLHLDLIEDINKFEMAKVSVEGGNAAFQCVKKVIELAMAGEVDATCTNALNILCFCPPESCVGLKSALSERPTRSNASIPICLLSFLLTPAYMSGRHTLSNALSLGMSWKF